MQLRSLVVIILACAIGVLSWAIAPSAYALTQIKLSDLSYHACSGKLAEGNVVSGSSQEANCFMIEGKASNPTNKTVYDADIFGRVYDANNNPVMQNRNRLGSIREVPPGESDFELRITVARSQPTPLKLQKFKASGFSSKVRY